MPSALASPSLLPLIFGPFDPTGAANLPVDAVICARQGLPAGCVATAIHVQSTTGTESIQRLSPDLIDDQARCLLEDMRFGALKIGPQYDPESVALLAQIAADYSHMPLVLQPGSWPLVPGTQEQDPDDIQGALLDLLLPQTCVLVIDAGQAEQWATQGLLSGTEADDPMMALLELGADHVLCLDTPISSELQGVALYSRDQASQRWPWPNSAIRSHERASLLATLLTCLLAQGVDPALACREAASQAAKRLAHYFHPGMGQAILRHTTP